MATRIATCRSGKPPIWSKKCTPKKSNPSRCNALTIQRVNTPPGEIHDLLRWSDWIRAYHATAEFFDRRLAASDEGH
jgi:hypothetical protein